MFYFKMPYNSLFISRFRFALLGLHVTRRYFVTFVRVAALYKKRSSCYCHPAVFGGCLAVRTTHSGINRTATMSYAACLLLLAAVFVPAFGMMFYYRREQQKLLEQYEDETVYHTPFVDTKTGLLVQHNGNWFPIVMFPNLHRFEQIRHFTLKDDDIVIVSFPKSGTTWLQQIVWLIVNGGTAGNDGLNIEQRFPYIEYEYPGLSEIGKMRSPRLIKSHLPYRCLPAGIEAGHGKVLYIARNAKDVCVSYYHFYRMMSMVKYHGNFTDFCKLFISGRVAYGPWQDHVGDFWDHRYDKNVLFLSYEDLHQQPELMVSKISEFLGRSLSAEQISDIVRWTHFIVMKQDSSVNYSWWDELGMRLPSESQFMRKGVVGDWMNYFTTDMEADIYQCCIEPLQHQGLTFTDRPH